MEEAKAICPACGSTFPAGATFCPKCGYVLPVTPPVTAAPEQARPANATPNVVLIQPHETEQRGSTWGAWAALAVFVLLVGGGLIFWGNTQLGGSKPPEQPARVIIENSPQMSTEKPGANTAAPSGAAPTAASPPAAAAPPAAPQPAAPQQAAPQPAAPQNTPQLSLGQVAATPAVDIISVRGQPITMNAFEWNYGYTLHVRNNTATDVRTNFRIQFLDANGYTVDDDLMNDVYIPAYTEITLNGSDMIPASQAATVRTLYASVR